MLSLGEQVVLQKFPDNSQCKSIENVGTSAGLPYLLYCHIGSVTPQRHAILSAGTFASSLRIAQVWASLIGFRTSTDGTKVQAGRNVYTMFSAKPNGRDRALRRRIVCLSRSI